MEMYFSMQLERQVSSDEDMDEPGLGMQWSKQLLLTRWKSLDMRTAKTMSVSGCLGAYTDQGSGVVNGRFCLDLLDDGGLGLLRVGGGADAGAGAEESHGCGGDTLFEMG